MKFKIRKVSYGLWIRVGLGLGIQLFTAIDGHFKHCAVKFLVIVD